MSDYDPHDIEGQKAAEQDRALRERLASESEVEDVKWLMGKKQGRRIVHRLLSKAGVFHSIFNTNFGVMAFEEGRRDAARRILGLVNVHCSDLYPLMMREAAQDKHD